MKIDLAQFDHLRDLVRGFESILQAIEVLKDGQAVIFDRLCDVLEPDDGTTALRADPRTAEFRAPELVDRDDDLNRLWDELDVAASGGFVVVQAGPWAGKTALIAEVAADPPPEFDVVSFFIRAVGRRNTAEHFLDVVNAQLCGLLGRGPERGHDLASRRSGFEMLWAEAVESAATRSRLIVLLVDGLDEQDQTADVPISALLPALRTGSSRVLVATRPNPRHPPQLPGAHPYYDGCEHPFELSPSPAAQAVARRQVS